MCEKLKVKSELGAERRSKCVEGCHPPQWPLSARGVEPWLPDRLDHIGAVGATPVMMEGLGAAVFGIPGLPSFLGCARPPSSPSVWVYREAVRPWEPLETGGMSSIRRRGGVVFAWNRWYSLSAPG